MTTNITYITKDNTTLEKEQKTTNITERTKDNKTLQKEQKTTQHYI